MFVGILSLPGYDYFNLLWVETGFAPKYYVFPTIDSIWVTYIRNMKRILIFKIVKCKMNLFRRQWA